MANKKSQYVKINSDLDYSFVAHLNVSKLVLDPNFWRNDIFLMLDGSCFQWHMCTTDASRLVGLLSPPTPKISPKLTFHQYPPLQKLADENASLHIAQPLASLQEFFSPTTFILEMINVISHP